MKVSRIIGCALALACTYQGLTQKRGFNVRDEIEMNTFSEPSALEPNASANISPDGRYVLIVTSHGIIRTDQVESSLWIVSNSAINRYIRSGDDTDQPPKPSLVFRLSAIPVRDSSIPFNPVISDLRWASDSRSVYFLGLNSYGRRQLRVLNVTSGIARTLTPAGYDVERYNFRKSLIVYMAVRADPKDTAEIKRSGGAIPIAGRFITKVLFPGRELKPEVHELWFIRDGRLHRAADPSTKDQTDLEHYFDVLSISPDGRSVVQIKPVSAIPQSWEEYTPETGKDDWRISRGYSKTTFPSNIFRARQYVLTDLDSGRSRPVFDAPYADTLAYIESFQAEWSPTGKRLLLTNTFLPLEETDPAERARRLYPCTTAMVDVALGKPQCIAFTRDSPRVVTDPTRLLELQSAAFAGSDDDVVLQLRSKKSQKIQIERYHYEGGVWQLSQTVAKPEQQTKKDTAASTSVYVRQSLNDPPALWARDVATGKNKKLWDPNPQFANLEFGAASVYHWKDESGFEWTGGLVKPVGYIPGKRYPLVIQTHGFADFAFITNGFFPTAMAARPLASQGIAVLQVLGNSQHVGALIEAQDNASGYETAIRQLDGEGLIDPKRVGIVGFSRTAWYVETALVEKPTLFAAASINDGIDHSYMQAMLFDPDRVSEGQEIYHAKPFGEGLQTWLKLAPGFHLDVVQTPALITAIGPASVLEEWELYSSLYQQRKPVDFLYIPYGQHILQKPLDRLSSQQGNVDWFAFWLQGYERPNPEEPDQYKRWEHLRELRDANDKAAGRPVSPNPAKPN